MKAMPGGADISFGIRMSYSCTIEKSLSNLHQIMDCNAVARNTHAAHGHQKNHYLSLSTLSFSSFVRYNDIVLIFCHFLVFIQALGWQVFNIFFILQKISFL
jgi:hypothetical protein